MTSTNRCIHAVVALSDCQEVMAERIHLLIHWMRKKLLKQFCSTYLQWHSQQPPSSFIFVTFCAPWIKFSIVSVMSSAKPYICILLFQFWMVLLGIYSWIVLFVCLCWCRVWIVVLLLGPLAYILFLFLLFPRCCLHVLLLLWILLSLFSSM